MPRFYLTTAIDYSNGDPHLGHAIEKIGADVIARYRRACGDDVHFLIGMDEHGQKVQQEAEKNGSSPQAWVDRIAESFLEVWDRLGLSNDDFIRTSEPRHHRGLTTLMKRIAANGDFRRAKYEGYYCAGCEAFKKEEELEDGRVFAPPRSRSGMDGRGQLVLPALRLPGRAARPPAGRPRLGAPPDAA